MTASLVVSQARPRPRAGQGQRSDTALWPRIDFMPWMQRLFAFFWDRKRGLPSSHLHQPPPKQNGERHFLDFLTRIFLFPSPSFTILPSPVRADMRNTVETQKASISAHLTRMTQDSSPVGSIHPIMYSLLRTRNRYLRKSKQRNSVRTQSTPQLPLPCRLVSRRRDGSGGRKADLGSIRSIREGPRSLRRAFLKVKPLKLK